MKRSPKTPLQTFDLIYFAAEAALAFFTAGFATFALTAFLTTGAEAGATGADAVANEATANRDTKVAIKIFFIKYSLN